MKIFLSLLIVFFAIVSYTAIPDQYAQATLDASLHRAFVAFGLAKALNGIISLLQGTQLTLTPAGIGVNLSIGELLDPFNDMVERFSWIMLLSTVSLGIQKFLLVFSSKLFVKIVVLSAALWSLIVLWSKNARLSKTLHTSLKIVVLLFLLRFFAVVSVYTSETVYQTVLKDPYTTATRRISDTRETLQKFQEENMKKKEKEKRSITEFFSDKLDQVKDSLNVSKRFETLQKIIDGAYDYIIELITVFVIQTVLLPLLYLWLLMAFLRNLFGWKPRSLPL